MGATRPRVVCLDTVMMDVVVTVEQLPARGGDALASRRVVSAGGGFNLMSAARRQGVDALYVGQLGVGHFADRARESLAAEGVTVALGARGELDLGVCIVIVDSLGERTFVTSPGAELTMTAEELAGVTVGPGDVVYLSGYDVVYPELAPVVAPWLGTLREDVVVAFDPGPRVGDIDPDVLSGVLARTTWLLLNVAEAHELSGYHVARDAAQALRATTRCAVVVVRDGERGSVGVDANGTVVAPGFSVDVVDTNGAGDVHNAVLMGELLRGRPLEEALVRANAAAALSIGDVGPATGPTSARVDEFLERPSRGSGGD